ncbi:MAG: 16S rRNA (guanine(527)-N(7))-methyltransferase RsmG [Pseudomarimonas sp.]
MNALRPALRVELARLGLDESLDSCLLAYLALLMQWNQAYNLTAIRDPHEMLVKHLFDSLAILAFVPSGTLVDIGSGAGLPAIPLALALPDLRVTMIETAGKKARFLREAVRALGLSERVRVLSARAENVDEAGRHDCLTARAFGTLEQILHIGGHLLRPGGQLLAMKGRDPSHELSDLPAGWRHVATHRLLVPDLEGERCLCVVESTSACTEL